MSAVKAADSATLNPTTTPSLLQKAALLLLLQRRQLLPLHRFHPHLQLERQLQRLLEHNSSLEHVLQMQTARRHVVDSSLGSVRVQ